ncbi:MAG: DUF427 domain-containing protein [Rhodospirillales bacterium]|nr:DUF427 domain-containing protein [Rhodospirillales bacterium]
MGNTNSNSGPGYAKHPDHKVIVERHPGRHRIVINGEVVADSSDTLLMNESGYERVHYFPCKDVRMDMMPSNTHHTFCPFKGEASYWDFDASGGLVENAAWGYLEPFDEVSELKGFVAFDTEKIDEIIFG